MTNPPRPHTSPAAPPGARRGAVAARTPVTLMNPAVHTRLTLALWRRRSGDRDLGRGEVTCNTHTRTHSGALKA